MAMALLPPSRAPCGAASLLGAAHCRRVFFQLRFRIEANSCSRSNHISWKCAAVGDASSLAREETTSSSLVADEAEAVRPDGRLLPGTDLSSITEWELDFCSRPILDDRGKKLWELIVCDRKRQLEFARFYRSNVINSVTLKRALLEIMETFGLPKPMKVRFFRAQVQTIIKKACTELDIQAVPSQRCITLVKWLQERYEPVYRQHPGFQEGAALQAVPEVNFLKPLPQNLRGDKWAFVQLPFKVLREEMTLVEKGSTFGNVELYTDPPSPDTLVPGVAVASSRDVPLSAWTQSLELVSLDVDRTKGCLALSTGVSDVWRYASYGRSKQADEEADAWEAAKKACGGLHFLAIQPSLDSESCSGLWLLSNAPVPPV